MKTLKILALVLLVAFAGCKTVDSNISTDSIVAKYTSQYIEISTTDTNTDNHDIAAMLQTVSVDLIRHPSESWQDVMVREDQYISVVTTGVISRVYTIRASTNEIKIVDGFCDEVLEYLSSIEPDYASFAGDLLSESSTRFIVNMDNYEYEKFRNNR